LEALENKAEKSISGLGNLVILGEIRVKEDSIKIILGFQ
jgi:hypothetical protein